MREDCIRGSRIYLEHLWRQAGAIMPLSQNAQKQNSDQARNDGMYLGRLRLYRETLSQNTNKWTKLFCLLLRGWGRKGLKTLLEYRNIWFKCTESLSWSVSKSVPRQPSV